MLSCWPHSPPRLAGFKSRRANKPQTGLTLNYLHEWRANPIFIFTWPWNALCDLYGTDLPGCFRFAWMSRDNDFQYAHRLLVKPASQPQSGEEGKSIWVENLTELTHRSCHPPGCPPTPPSCGLFFQFIIFIHSKHEGRLQLLLSC